MSKRGLLPVTLAALVALGLTAHADAQWLPSEPLSIAEGRLTIGGNVSATFSCAASPVESAGACADDTGFFNYTDYEHSALRMLVLDVTAAVHATDRVSILGELRSENAGQPQPYALYVRIRPWAARGFAIQAGRVPPTFGAFARRMYPSDNLLIGYPLAYQYLTSLRADALPASADDLLGQRGRGWLSRFPLGNPQPARGLPLVSAFRWDTGVQAHATTIRWDAALSVTTGTQANPLVRDDNDGKQVSGRASFRATPGLVLGASAAHGAFITRDAAAAAGVGDHAGDYTQTAWGADVEYSRDYYLLRAEAIVSDWRVPVVASPAIDLPLRAIAASAEGRYRIRPGLYAAARLDHLSFSHITGARRDRWDAPVTRVEVGGGYSLQRNLLLKGSVQHNTREAGRNRSLLLGAVQVVFWF